MVVFGTRPEAIKLAPVVHRLRHEPRATTVTVSTGQHREMLAQALEIFSITPDHDLALMRPRQDLTDLTAAALLGMRNLIALERPDVVVVQGDTTTVVAASLAAFYANVPVAHVEAGLRTGDLRQPFPEEMNRRVADSISDMLFAPTPWARDNLLREGYPAERILVTGNTVIDALQMAAKRVEGLTVPPGLEPALAQVLQQATSYGRRLVLVTGHRRENFGQGVRNLALALRDLAEAVPEVEVVYPVHLNPNVQQPVHELLGDCPRVRLVPPLPYGAFVWLLARATLVLTDSGGVQEEAPGLGKPVLVTREKTERPEAIDAGVARLVGTNRESIRDAALLLLRDGTAYQQMAHAVSPFGDGKAAERIVAALVSRYGSIST
jgi:UDP-N-acetylglucosamine 2-epimerase